MSSNGSATLLVDLPYIYEKILGRFHIQRHKESTGRVVFWAMGIMCSYTMEASYGGTNMGSRAFTHFNTEDYEGVGRYFCETLLDHQV